MKSHEFGKSVFKEELDEVQKRHGQEVEGKLVGIAFSGGGIRSATFGLGVLEGLKSFGLLEKIHYLSTVSGGGYIGAWLSGNCNRTDGWLKKGADWTDSIGHLRRYSNYLSPKVGFFSADTWSMATIWLRNTLLIQLTVILAIAVALLVPRPLFALFKIWPTVGDWRWTTIILFILGVVGIAGNQLLLNQKIRLLQANNWPRATALSAVLLILARVYGSLAGFDPFHGGEQNYLQAGPIALLLVMAGFFLQPLAVTLAGRFPLRDNPPSQVNYGQGWVQGLVVVPMMATGYLVAAILWGEAQPVAGVTGGLAGLNSFGEYFTTAWRFWPFPLSVLFLSTLLLSCCSFRDRKKWKGWAAAALASVVAVIVLHALLCVIMLVLNSWVKDSDDGARLAFIWTPGMVLYSFSLTIVMLIGMMGRQSDEGVREWWSRLGAWLGIYGSAWMIIALSAYYGPIWVNQFFHADWKSFSVAGGAIGTILSGLFAGGSNKTGGKEKTDKSSTVLEIVAEVAPFVFIAALLTGVGTALDTIIKINTTPTPELTVTWYLLAGCIAALILMAMRVDINEFSLNAFYRNRLVRCYLGATRFRPGERKPQNFTGFDDNDDLRMADLDKGPLHIVNCALNLGGSSDLALHTRHSANFTLSRLSCGSSYRSREQTGETQELGYIATNRYGGPDGSPTLGEAMSVSGAAASPNMGYHTSPVVAFLLTVFNVRLGWWFPNPRKSGIELPSPHFNLRYLFAELFGGADDKSTFLMISDGGHFENLAAYELVRRRCRVIIISDAEADPKLRFEGLGTLIRMCDVDFGAKMTLDVESIRPCADSVWSANHCAVGTIDYGEGIPKGIVIYLKASMTGHEDTAVLQYKAAHPDFPHESTGDQFYGEDQFESYRRLGRDIAMRTFAPVASGTAAQTDIIGMAEELVDICSPTLHDAGKFTRNSKHLMDLWSQLAANSDLWDLDRETVGAAWPAQPPASFRSQFYTCCKMIQLMENVYLDLQLGETWNHTDNTGWRTLFTTWAQSELMQRTWAMTSNTYGLRFQHFCARNLNLPIIPTNPREREGGPNQMGKSARA